MRRYFSNLMAKGRETLTPKINEKLSKSFESAFPERHEVELKVNETIRTPQLSQSSSAQSHVQPGRSYKEELYASRRFDLNTSSNPNYAFRNLQSFLQDEKIPAKVREKRHFVRPGLVKHAVIYAGRRKKFNELVKGTISKINVLIVGAARTPVGSFLGSLSSFPATELGATAINGAVKGIIDKETVEECLMGNVLSANVGQAPARQAALLSGLPESTTCTTINKVCASGMKAVLLGAQSIMLGFKNIVVAGGMESMSRAPFYLDARGPKGLGYGDQKLIDAVLKDGLWDPKYQLHMGSCAEETAEKLKITREAQDAYAKESYERAIKASQSGQFKNEIVGVKTSNDTFVIEDEEINKVNFDKMMKLKPAFKAEGGTVTAGNASSLSDGASAVLLVSESAAIEKNLKPLARILAFADAECNPKDFPIAPSLAIPMALKRAGLRMEDVDLFEINEAFSVVVLANQQILKIDRNKLNIRGGGVSLGHPIGSSGCRLIVTLTHALESGQIGCAAICNGGGGASAIIIEKL